MSSDRLMLIHSPEFRAMAERALRVTELTERLNVLPFEDETGGHPAPTASWSAQSSRSSPARR